MTRVSIGSPKRIAAVLILALTPLRVGAADVSPAAIIADIGRDGAPKFVGRLSAEAGTQWKAVRAGIASGKDAWLGVARAIRPGVDAGTGEDLNTALATALRVNPAGVLRLVGPDFPLTHVCDVPLIEPTDAQVAAWKRNALAALDRVSDPSLAATVQDCRAALVAIK